MKISQLFQSSKPLISFEFFPPKTDEGLRSLKETMTALKDLAPSYISMTYGAGGSTRQKTVQLVADIKNEIGIEAVAHLTCVGHTRAELEDVLMELRAVGVKNILALRGDPPKGETTFVPVKDGFAHAADLVRLIRSKFDFCVGVAGYPEKHIEAPTIEDDIHRLTEKVNAGAEFIVTQLFFDNADYFQFVERVRCCGLSQPVVAGIMPITDFDQIKRFAQMCGAKIPTVLMEKLVAAGGDKARVIQIGIDHATAQCEELIRRGVAGLHFYTLNKSQSTREIFMSLKRKGLLA